MKYLVLCAGSPNTAVLRQESDGTFRAIAFIFKNNSARQPLKDAVVSVDDVEALVGYDLFTNLDDWVEDRIESRADWDDWIH